MLRMLHLQRLALPMVDADLSVLFSGSALWALAFYVPLSGPIARFEAELVAAGVAEIKRQVLLVLSSVALAAGVGVVWGKWGKKGSLPWRASFDVWHAMRREGANAYCQA